MKTLEEKKVTGLEEQRTEFKHVIPLNPAVDAFAAERKNAPVAACDCDNNCSTYVDACVWG
jgi:hypothetical protein